MKIENYLNILSKSGIDNEIRIGGIQNLLLKMIIDMKNELGYYGSMKVITKKLKVARRTFNGWLENHPLPISRFYQITHMWKTTCNKNTKDVANIKNKAFIESSYFSVSQGKKAVLPKHLTYDLAYIVGYIIGDGCLVDIWKKKENTGNFKYEIKIATDTQKFAKTLVKLIKKIFNVKSHIYKIPNSKCYEVFLQCKVIYIFLNKIFEMPMGKKKGKLKIPTIIGNASHRIKYAFIAGFFDADGCIYEKDKKITFCQADEVFLKEIKNLLKKLNINTGKISTRKKELGITYDFSLIVDSIPLFLRTIPLLHPNRISKAEKLRNIVTLNIR